MNFKLCRYLEECKLWQLIIQLNGNMMNWDLYERIIGYAVTRKNKNYVKQ